MVTILISGVSVCYDYFINLFSSLLSFGRIQRGRLKCMSTFTGMNCSHYNIYKYNVISFILISNGTLMRYQQSCSRMDRFLSKIYALPIKQIIQFSGSNFRFEASCIPKLVLFVCVIWAPCCRTLIEKRIHDPPKVCTAPPVEAVVDSVNRRWSQIEAGWIDAADLPRMDWRSRQRWIRSVDTRDHYQNV
jgi:hypothetical protein